MRQTPENYQMALEIINGGISLEELAQLDAKVLELVMAYHQEVNPLSLQDQEQDTQTTESAYETLN